MGKGQQPFSPLRTTKNFFLTGPSIPAAPYEELGPRVRGDDG